MGVGPIDQEFKSKGYITRGEILRNYPHITDHQMTNYETKHKTGIKKGSHTYYKPEDFEEILRLFNPGTYGKYKAPKGFYSYTDLTSAIGCGRSWLKKTVKKLGYGTLHGKKINFTEEEKKSLKERYDLIKASSWNLAQDQKQEIPGYKTINQLSKSSGVNAQRLRNIANKLHLGDKEILGFLLLTLYSQGDIIPEASSCNASCFIN